MLLQSFDGFIMKDWFLLSLVYHIRYYIEVLIIKTKMNRYIQLYISIYVAFIFQCQIQVVLCFFSLWYNSKVIKKQSKNKWVGVVRTCLLTGYSTGSARAALRKGGGRSYSNLRCRRRSAAAAASAEIGAAASFTACARTWSRCCWRGCQASWCTCIAAVSALVCIACAA